MLTSGLTQLLKESLKQYTGNAKKQKIEKGLRNINVSKQALGGQISNNDPNRQTPPARGSHKPSPPTDQPLRKEKEPTLNTQTMDMDSCDELMAQVLSHLLMGLRKSNKAKNTNQELFGINQPNHPKPLDIARHDIYSRERMRSTSYEDRATIAHTGIGMERGEKVIRHRSISRERHHQALAKEITNIVESS